MSVSSPSVSIIIPTYNRKAFLGETIDSVLNQTKAPAEIIVVDDGSTDGTRDFIKAGYEDQILYYRQKNRERGAARNYGASVAQGEYIYFLDSDDILYPEHIEKAVNFIKESDRPDWFFQEYEIIDGSAKRQIEYDRTNPLETLLSKGNFMSCHGVFLRRIFFEQHRFNEDRALAGSEDYELWVRLAAHRPLKINPIVTSALVEHDARSVFNFSLEKLLWRKELMLDLLLNNESVKKRFENYFSKLRSHTYSYIALHAAMIGEKKSSLHYWRKAVAASPSSMLQKRSLAILKHLFLT